MLTLQELDETTKKAKELNAASLLAEAAAKARTAEQLKQQSHDLKQTHQSEFENYAKIISKLKAHQEKYLADQATLLKYFLSQEGYEFIHGQYKKEQIYKTLNLLNQLADVISKNENTILSQLLNAAFSNSILIIENIGESNYRHCFENREFTNCMNALNNTLEKTIDYVSNPHDEARRTALSDSTAEMMQVVAPNFVSDRTRNLWVAAATISAIIGLVSFPLALLVLFNSVFFLPLLLATPIGLGLSGGLAEIAAMNISTQSTQANNVRTSLNQIAKPGFFNKQNTVQVVEENSMAEKRRLG